MIEICDETQPVTYSWGNFRTRFLADYAPDGKFFRKMPVPNRFWRAYFGTRPTTHSGCDTRRYNSAGEMIGEKNYSAHSRGGKSILRTIKRAEKHKIRVALNRLKTSLSDPYDDTIDTAYFDPPTDWWVLD